MISSEILEFEKIENPASKSLICSEILNDLPLWFGIPESNKEYEIEVKSKPFFAISLNKEIIGFLSVKRNNAYVLELYVLGIKEKYHRKGIGSMLIDFIEEYAINNNYQYLEVKTLDESRKSKEYEKTRMFYLNCGFIPIDVLENEWGKQNPCLIMLKSLVNRKNRPTTAST